MRDGLSSEYVQLESRPFHADWDVAFLGPLVAQFGTENIALVRRFRVATNRWAFVLPLNVPGAARWNGVAVRGGSLIVCAPGSESFAFDPRGMSFAILSMAERHLPVALEALGGVVASGESVVVRPVLRHVRALHDHLSEVRALAAPGVRISEPEARAARLNARLAACLTSAVAPTASGGSAIVRRAEAFFRTHVGEPVSIAQLSEVAGVSERSLRNAFYRVYTTSPKRYLKLWQLHQVRRALRAVGRPQPTVTDVATFHGFYELGRFAGEYKALFGERPSQTLQRARLRQAVEIGAA